jgi:hypothetical protein
MGSAVFCFIASLASLGFGLYERARLDGFINDVGNSSGAMASVALSGIATVRDVRFLGFSVLAAVFFVGALVLTKMSQQVKPADPQPPQPNS